MLLLKERLKIGLLLFGILVGAYGFFMLMPFKKTEETMPLHSEGQYASVAGHESLAHYAPWMIVFSGVLLLCAYLLREK